MPTVTVPPTLEHVPMIAPTAGSAIDVAILDPLVSC